MVTQARTVGMLLAAAIGASASNGCVARVHGEAHTNAVVESEPSLVLVDGVWVVEDYDEPVFYDEGFYWRFYGGVWYRSNVHTGNWVRVDVVPGRVRAIDRPTRFVHFHAAATAEKRRGPPPHAEAHGLRGDQPGHEMGGGPDHADKADMKAEKKEEKAEEKAEKKEEKAEEKADKKDAKADAKAAKEAEKAAKEQEKADKKAAKEAEKAAKEKEKADAKAAKEAAKAEKKEKAKEDKEAGGGGGKKGKKEKGEQP